MINRKLCGIAALTAAALASSGCTKLKARDELNRGVNQFKNAKYTEAVDHFKKAVDYDPSFSTARLYLATAYMSQYIPGADSPDNLQNAKAAKDNFMKVLEQDPSSTVAIMSLASLSYNQASGLQNLDDKLKKLDEAKEWYKKLVEVDPKNKEGHYSLGVIAWAKWYPALAQARNKLGMKPDDPGPLKDPKIREELKGKYLDMVNDGIKHLETALQIDPEYDDAMAYMNLLIRERADLSDSPEQYKKDIETADNWVQKTLETKKVKAERVNNKTGGIRAQ